MTSEIKDIDGLLQSWNSNTVRIWDVYNIGVSRVREFRFEGTGIGNGGFKTFEELLDGNQFSRGLRRYFDNTGNIKTGIMITPLRQVYILHIVMKVDYKRG